MDLILQCLEYVMHTPCNTNPNVLKDLLIQIYGTQIDNTTLSIDYTDGNLYATMPDISNISFSLEDGVLSYSY